MVEFDDVKKCRDIRDFQDFLKHYFMEHAIPEGTKKLTTRTLFYTWNKSRENVAAKVANAELSGIVTLQKQDTGHITREA
jgi:hypothetical protein